jgi:hypothetical protein
LEPKLNRSNNVPLLPPPPPPCEREYLNAVEVAWYLAEAMARILHPIIRERSKKVVPLKNFVHTTTQPLMVIKVI